MTFEHWGGWKYVIIGDLDELGKRRYVLFGYDHGEPVAIPGYQSTLEMVHYGDFAEVFEGREELDVVDEVFKKAQPAKLAVPREEPARAAKKMKETIIKITEMSYE